MKLIGPLVLASTLGLAGLATAQSPVLPVQGTLRSTAGDLINDDQNVTFRLYNDRTGGEAFWEVEKLVKFRMGQFVAYLGDAEPIDPVDFEGLPEVWLGIQVAPETVEMTPRVRLGTSPFALYAQLCGEATTATTASSANTATTASTANDLNCSGCVGATQLDSATNNRINDVDCDGCVDGADVNLGSFSTFEVQIVGNGYNTDVCSPYQDAVFCALSLVSRDDQEPSPSLSSYCFVDRRSQGWRVCARGNNVSTEPPGTIMGCYMQCLRLNR